MTSKADARISEGSAVEQAIEAAKLGYHVVQIYPVENGRCTCGNPDRCDSPGKHPIGGDKRTTTDEATIRAWWSARPNANVGVNLALSGLVDVSSDSDKALVDFRARGLPATASFESGSGPGHEHNLYRRPEGCPVTRDCRSGVLDLMSMGVAVLPPSVSGKGAYRWLQPLDQPVSVLPEAPAWVSAELSRRSERDSEYSVDEDQPPVPLVGEALERWHGRLWKQTPDGGIDESGTLVQIANDLARAGLTMNGVYQLVQERAKRLGYGKYETRADRELRYLEIAGSAVERYGPRAATAGLFEVISFAEARHRPRPKWLVEGLLVQGTIATLYGASGGGKTFVALDLAMRVALGMDFHGRQVVRGPVLYVACEDGEGVAQRIDGWCTHHGVSDEQLEGTGGLIPSSANLRDPNQAAALVEAVAGMPEPPKVVVIDTLAWAMVGGDENQVQDLMLVMDAARRLHQFGTAVLIVHHTGKKGDEERGSSALRAGSYTMAKLSGGDGRLTLEIDKMKGAQAGDPMAFRLLPVATTPGEGEDPDDFVALTTTCVIEPTAGGAAEAGKGAITPSERAVLLAMVESFQADEPVSYSRIKAVVTMADKSFERALKGLRARGFIATDGPRKPYTVTEEGRAATADGASDQESPSRRADGLPPSPPSGHRQSTVVTVAQGPPPPPSPPSHPVGVTVDGGGDGGGGAEGTAASRFGLPTTAPPGPAPTMDEQGSG